MGFQVGRVSQNHCPQVGWLVTDKCRHEFEWKREDAFMLRKPDPPVSCCGNEGTAGRIKTSTVQFLITISIVGLRSDHSLFGNCSYFYHAVSSFDIEDRKGLEIVILTALLTFQDSSDVNHGVSVKRIHHPIPRPYLHLALGRLLKGLRSSTETGSANGVDRIAEMQAVRREVNEVSGRR